MEVIVVAKGTYDREMTVTIPANTVGERYQQEIRKLASTVKLPGFRPGKVPTKVVESMLRQEVAGGVAEELFRETYGNALQQEKVRPVGPPALKMGNLQPGTPFSYTATFQVYPQTDPQGYTDLPLTRLQVTIGEEQVDTVVERLREKHANYLPTPDHKAAKGDQVRLSLVGRVGDRTFTGDKPAEQIVTLGSGRFVDTFEDQLLGCAAGEHREVDVTFPADYHEAQLAGQPAHFDCEILEVKQCVLPEVDDALAVKAGQQSGGIEALRQRIRSQLENDAANRVNSHLKQQIMKQLLANNVMELPSQLVDQETDALVQRAKENLRQQGFKSDELFTQVQSATWKPLYEKEATERITLGMVMGAIASREAITAEEADVDGYLAMMQARPESPAGLTAWIKSQPEQLEEIRGVVLEQKVIDWIKSHSRITEEPRSYEALVAEEANARGNAAG
ncbi:MAG: trigger factor [Magnetococcales bacterium]|nr:trigger factor [Magnetococcales bacterium]